MNKTLLIFRHELIQAIKKPGYIILTLAVPVLALLAIGVSELFSALSEPDVQELTHVGYVDQVGLFNAYHDQGLIVFVPYQVEEDALEAMAAGDISEYVLIPQDFIETGKIHRFTKAREIETPPGKKYLINSFLTWNLLKDEVQPEIIQSIVSPLNISVTRLEDDGSISGSQSNIGNIIIPGMFAFLLIMALMFGSNSLISGLGEEKESRLIEVLASSVSVTQLLAGKVMALGTAGLLQVVVWLVSSPLLIKLASSRLGGFFSAIQIPGNFIILGVVYFILGYLLFAVLSLTVGGITSTAADGHNLSMFYIMAGFIPLWTVGAFINFPEHPVWVALSIFPVTAPTQAMLQLGVSGIPAWQIAVSIGVLIFSIALGQYLSVKIFRTFMLMVGKRHSIKDIFLEIRNA